MNSSAPHIPVLLEEVVAALAPFDNEIFIDATFGLGGYSKLLLESANCNVIGIDRDPAAIEKSQALVQHYHPRLTVLAGCFGQLNSLVHQPVDGITFDLGVSSPQLDEAERGFSFSRDGPLDMRMSQSGQTAADIVNATPEKQLADLIYQYGEERHSRRIAKHIINIRKKTSITTTLQLATLVAEVVPKSKDGIHPATRTFQALRIAVNDELHEIEKGLKAAESLLKPGGRLAVVSFHSLEDRIVKNFLKTHSGQTANPSRHMPAAPQQKQAIFEIINKKPIVPSEEEIANNPRARSAKLRVATKLGAAA